MDARLQEIECREQEDPDQIHEMPEEPRVLDAIGKPLRVRLPERRAGPQEVGVHTHAAEHMEHVQARQGEVEGEEVAVAWELARAEMVTVFEVLDHEENGPEEDRDPHVDPEGPEA